VHDIARWRTSQPARRHRDGLGPEPVNVRDLDRWDRLQLRISATHDWLDSRHEPIQTARRLTAADLHSRRQELRELLATAPADQQQTIERLLTVRADPTEVHRLLTAANAIQHERRQWILKHWAELVELNEIAELITNQPPFAHWPTATPEPVQQVLRHLATFAPNLDRREERTLHHLTVDAAANDPVIQLRARLTAVTDRMTKHRATLADEAADGDVIEQAHRQLSVHAREIARLHAELNAARAAQFVAHYDTPGPNATETAEQQRLLTVTYDTLTQPPAWVTAYLTGLHHTGELDNVDAGELADTITEHAIERDRHPASDQLEPIDRHDTIAPRDVTG